MSAEAIQSFELDGERFETFLTAVGAVDREARLEFREGEIVGRVVDAATVAMGEVVLTVDHAVPDCTVGVNVDRLRSLVEAIGCSSYETTVDPSERGLRLESGVERFDVAMIDPDSVRGEELPDLEHATEWHPHPSKIARAFRMVGEMDVHPVFEWSKAGLGTILAEGDGDEYEAEFTNLTVSGEPGASLYPAEYLTQLADVLAATDRVTCEMAGEGPIEITCEMDNPTAKYMIAPRITEAPNR